MSAIFGGSKSKQQSTSTSVSDNHNQAYPFIQNAYGSTASGTGDIFSSLKNLLGLGDTNAGNAALDNYHASTGYDDQLKQGSQAITGNLASKGLLNSGSTLKALNTYGQQTAAKSFGDYLSQLFNLGGMGLQAGSLISGAGNTASSQSNSQSTGSSSSNPGIGQFIGQIASAAAGSDRRLKKDIVKLSELADGLGVYEWTYINGGNRYIGHMADEIEKLRPWALGPTVSGYQTVDYSKV